MDSIQFIEKIRRFNRNYANILGKIDQEIYNQPYSLTEARVISELHSRMGCTATEIRENLGLDRGYMSRIVQRFEDEKIIKKEQSSEDKRQYVLDLTDKGEAIFNQLVEHAKRGIERMINNLSSNELSDLVASMETIEAIFLKDYLPQPVIRPFEPGDAGYVAELHGKLYANTYKFGRVFEYYVMKGLTEFMINTEGGELWVAEVNGKNVGSIAITKSSESTAQLRWFVIDENYQGMGIGKKLIETALDFCKQLNYQHVFLWTVNTLETARILYQKYHFRLTEEKPNEEWTGSILIEERWDLKLSDEN